MLVKQPNKPGYYILATGYYGDMDERWYDETTFKDEKSFADYLPVLTNIEYSEDREAEAQRISAIIGKEVSGDAIPFHYDYYCTPSIEDVTEYHIDDLGVIHYYRWEN